MIDVRPTSFQGLQGHPAKTAGRFRIVVQLFWILEIPEC